MKFTICCQNQKVKRSILIFLCVLFIFNKSDRTDHLIYNNYMREPDEIPYSHAAGSFDSHDIFITRPEPNRRSSCRS